MARRSASLIVHKHFGSAVSRTAQLLVLILDSARTKCYATCSVSYRYFMHKYLFVPQSRYVSQSRAYQHQRRFPVRKSSHHSRPSSYLAIHSLYHVIRSYFQPTLREKFHIRHSFAAPVNSSASLSKSSFNVSSTLFLANSFNSNLTAASFNCIILSDMLHYSFECCIFLFHFIRVLLARLFLYAFLQFAIYLIFFSKHAKTTGT